MVPITILRDNREQKPWEFADHDVSVEDVTLGTGDYTIAEFCDHNEETDTYYPHYAIERKSGSDLVSSIGSDSDRFEKELERADSWECPLRVFVEVSRSSSRYSNPQWLQYTKLDQNQINGIIAGMEREYNVEFTFAGSRQNAERKAYSTLLSRLRAVLTSPD